MTDVPKTLLYEVIGVMKQRERGIITDLVMVSSECELTNVSTLQYVHWIYL